MKQTIYIGADHAGFLLKEKIKTFLRQKNYVLEDCGNTVLDQNDDYPDFAYRVAQEVAAHNARGILFCGSAEGMSIAANKVKDIRAVVVHDLREAKLTREHNNANILCISGWNTPFLRAQRIVLVWLTTAFSPAQRHRRRVNKIMRIEQREMA